ncbi:MAG TPA: P-loop NTPase [Planctomycetaceae bacterium]|nr:P-loop NTPase [Planctomycetaceae bacterium]
MVILVVSDCQTKATRLRHLLAQNGCDCPLANVLPIEAAANAVSCFYPKPDLILFVLSDDVGRCHDALEHLRELSGVDVVVVGPRDPNSILGALHAGAASYLDETSDLERDLAATLGRLSTAEPGKSPAGQLISVVSASGGCGRTLVAANLAVALAKKHGRCGLFDLDLQGGDLATSLNLKPRHSIVDLCRNIDKLDQKMFEQSLVDHECGVSVLAGPDNWEDARHVTLDGLQKTLRFGRSLFTNIVADLDAFWQKDFAYPLQQSTAVVLLVRLDFAAVRKARRALSCFERNGVDRDNVLLVAARSGRHKEIGAAQIESALGMKIRHYVPEDPGAANSSTNCGSPVVLELPSSALSKSIVALAATIASDMGRGAAGKADNGKASLSKKFKTFFSLSAQELARTK